MPKRPTKKPRPSSAPEIVIGGLACGADNAKGMAHAS
jgi:hypothetical protein